MARETRGQKLGQLLDSKESDAANNREALRLQVLAWRQIALIGMVEPERAAKLARTVFFNSVPYVNDVTLKKIIEDTIDDSEKCGKLAGVFS